MEVSEGIDDGRAVDDQSTDVDVKAAAKALESIVKADPSRKWSSPCLLTFGTVSWRPDACGKGNAVLHVALLTELPKYVARRLRAAHVGGYRVHVAITTVALFQTDWVKLLVEIDAELFIIDDFERRARFKRRHILAAIADLQIPVSPTFRAALGTIALENIESGNSQEKGRRLEALLAFLFSQVSDFRVVLRNHRNKSQEIDLTIQIDNFSGRVWFTPGKPLVLVEAKNRKEKTDQPAFSVLVTKIRTKRQAVRIGFLVSPTGFTADLEKESLRYSESELCIVLIDGKRLKELVLSPDLDGDLERLVIQTLMD